MEDEIEKMKKTDPKIKPKRAVALSTKKWEGLDAKSRKKFARGKKRKKHASGSRKRRKILRDFSTTQGVVVEVFCERERKWLIIKDDKIYEDGHHSEEYQNAAYIRAVDNNQFGKDVTPRYCKRFVSSYKRRPDKELYRNVTDAMNYQ